MSVVHHIHDTDRQRRISSATGCQHQSHDTHAHITVVFFMIALR